MPVVHHKAPVSNLQRQRQFRARNPHYYRDLHRKRKANEAKLGAVMAAHPELSAAEAYKLVHAPAPGSQTTAPVEQPSEPAPLALPAAISEPLVTVQLPLFEQAAEPIEVRPKLTPADVVQRYKDAA